ncbi:hypothetical protein NC99_31000 [Sunxiuqinia dokdonensis]|uniref:Uncharacterized protein n=1 Tax=Sunxiuqinia dokdonensis TaxID=1409788 RepID=A0A0L8V7C6_9BACT|nr:hypothetical protein NC99_31000 [Sunxiuqinia dokdonensis]
MSLAKILLLTKSPSFPEYSGKEGVLPVYREGGGWEYFFFINLVAWC